MSEREKALGALLIRIADLATSAEHQGIVANPPLEVLAPLIRDANAFGAGVGPDATLEELHRAVAMAAQDTRQLIVAPSPPADAPC